MIGRYIPARLVVRESCRIPTELIEEEAHRVRSES
jgi:hypothetical protein